MNKHWFSNYSPSKTVDDYLSIINIFKLNCESHFVNNKQNK